MHRVGVYVDETLHWLDNQSWQIQIRMEDTSLISSITATNDELQVKLQFEDCLYNEKNIFIRKIHVTNLSEKQRQIKLFFNHEFKISESRRGDTAYYDPMHNYMVHYKGRRVFILNTSGGERGIEEYTTGQFGLPGQEGTFRDAEDGHLAGNPIRHGKVDSTFSVSVDLGYQQVESVHYWMVIASSIEEGRDLNKYVVEKTPDYIIQTTKDFWHAWVHKRDYSFHGLSDEIVDLFKKSLLYTRTHIDNRGSILASGDTEMLHHGFDTYSYMWPRDGALTTVSMIRAGYMNKAKSFFEYCNEALSDGGYMFHKYRPDGSLGSSWHPWIKNGQPSLPIQEDETALVLYALWEYYEATKDLEFIEQIYDSLIQSSASFLVSYRDTETGLPLPSYDLWEERHGVTTFSTASVIAGLRAAARFAHILGKEDEEETYTKTAEQIKEALLTYLYSSDHAFSRMLNREETKIVYDRTIDISSFYALFAFDILPIDDDRLNHMRAVVEEKLILRTDIGGVARNEDDYYYKVDQNTPGNPWIITTLWLAQYYIRRAQRETDFAPVKHWLEWCVKYALPSGVLPEQIDPHTGIPVAATPLTWSHAEYVETIMLYHKKIDELGIKNDEKPDSQSPQS
jgi:GH15 family glucan-1,4-alpha-glucosidase